MIKTIYFHHAIPAFNPQIEYIIDFLQHHPLTPAQVRWAQNEVPSPHDLVITYGSKPTAASYFIPTQQLLFSQKLPNITTLQPGAYTFEQYRLYSVETTQKSEEVFLQDGQFGFDIIETLFFHLSRYEEYHSQPDQWDEWEMMKSSEQFLSKYQLQERPVVDHLVYCFYQALGLRPALRPTTFRLSHDIDAIRKFTSPYKLLRASARLLQQGRSWGNLGTLVRTYRDSKSGRIRDPYDTFEWLLKADGVGEKVIYFLAGGITRYDKFCQIEHPALPSILDLAKERGYQIGLHPSYAAHTNEQLFQKEQACLEQKCGHSIQHSRQHFLHFDFKQTPQLIERQQMQQDSSLGYQDTIGFRCGTGFAYALYHFEEQRSYHFKEQPLVFMDTALLMETKEDMALFEQRLHRFLADNRYLTQITFNFHNSTFDDLRLDAAWLKRLYLELV